MKTIAKSAAIIFGVVLLILAGLGIYLTFGFDANQFKNQITQLVLEKKQRTLLIDSDLKLTLFPKLGVDIGRASLSAHQSTAPFARLDSAHVSLALLPLLKKELVIDRLELTGLELTFERNKDGKTNTDDLITSEDQSKQPLKFDIQGISLNNASLHIRDEMNDIVGTLRNVHFNSGRIANKVPTKLKLSTQFDAQKPKAKGHFSISSGLTFDLKEKSIRTENLDLLAQGMFENNVFDVSIKAPKLQANSTTQAVSAEHLSVLGSGSKATVSGETPLTVAQFKFNSELLVFDLAESNFILNKLSTSAKGKRGNEQFDAALDLPQLTINQQDAFGSSVKGVLTIAGTDKLDARFDLNKVTGTSDALHIASAIIDFTNKKGQRSISGHIETPISANVSAKQFALNKLLANLKIEDPDMPQKILQLPINGNLQGNIKKKTISGKLNTKFEDGNINMDFSLRDFTKPILKFNILADRFNLDRYLPPKKISAKADGSAVEAPFDLSALKALTLDGTVRIGAVQARNVKANDLSFDINATQGKINIAPIAARLYQGTMAGSVSVNANDYSFVLRPQFTNIHINTFLKDALGHDNLDGRGSLNLNLNARGNKPTALKQSLNGNVSVSLRDGAVKGINVAKSLRDFKNMIANGKNQQQAANPIEKTDFSALSASMRFTDGIGSSNDLLLKSPYLRVGGSGTLNVVEEQLDYIARVMVVNTSAGQDGADLAQLKNLTVPIRIKGPLDKLNYEIQFETIAKDALKAAVKEKVTPKIEAKKKEMTEKLNEKIKDKLKNLFGK